MREDNGIIEIEVRDKQFVCTSSIFGLVFRELLTNCRATTSDISKPMILMKGRTTSGDWPGPTRPPASMTLVLGWPTEAAASGYRESAPRTGKDTWRTGDRAPTATLTRYNSDNNLERKLKGGDYIPFSIYLPFTDKHQHKTCKSLPRER